MSRTERWILGLTASAPAAAAHAASAAAAGRWAAAAASAAVCAGLALLCTKRLAAEAEAGGTAWFRPAAAGSRDAEEAAVIAGYTAVLASAAIYGAELPGSWENALWGCLYGGAALASGLAGGLRFNLCVTAAGYKLYDAAEYGEPAFVLASKNRVDADRGPIKVVRIGPGALLETLERGDGRPGGTEAGRAPGTGEAGKNGDGGAGRAAAGPLRRNGG